MIERILELMKAQKISAYRFTTDCGLPNSAVSDWKVGRSKPKTDALVKIADYFQVSLDYLCGREERAAQPPALNEAQKACADLDAQMQDAVIRFIEDIRGVRSEKHQIKKKKA